LNGYISEVVTKKKLFKNDAWSMKYCTLKKNVLKNIPLYFEFLNFLTQSKLNLEKFV